MVKDAVDAVARNGGPWWVKAAYTLGVPAVIALLLIMFLTTTIDSRLEAVQVGQATIKANQATILTGLADAQRSSNEACYILRQVCLNTAQDATQRAACVAFK